MRWVALLVGVSGCTTVRPVQPAVFIPTNAPPVVWVTGGDNAVVPVADPEVAGDTLRGVRRGTRERVALPLKDLRTVKARLPDHAKTAVLLVGMGALATATVYAVWIAQAGPHTDGVYCGVYDSENEGPGGAPRPFC